MKTLSTALSLSLFAFAASAFGQNALPASGNVGAGTTTPGQPLESAADSSSIQLRLRRTGGSSAFADIGVDSIKGLSIWPDGYGVTSTTPKFVFSPSGNLGIGTTNPQAKLQIGDRTLFKDGTWAAPLTPNAISAGERIVFYEDAGWKTAIGMDPQNGIWFQAHTPGGAVAYQWFTGTAFSVPAEKMRIMQGGNVGIGTTNPGSTLEVNGAASGFPAVSGTNQGYASVRISNQQTNGVLDIGVNSASGAWLQYTNRTSLSESYPLLINPNGGNVGIGTTNPTQKLSVNGTIRAKEVIVDTGWSDFVFDESYELKALSETEAFIRAEKHLPGIPSASEVAENGISVGEMQAKLLAKIEEMTLHQIELEKRLSAQQRSLGSQAEEIGALKAQLSLRR